MKERLSVYLEPAIMAQLSAYAARRNKSLSLIAEAAVATFLSPDGPDQLERRCRAGWTGSRVRWTGSSATSASRSRCWRCSCGFG